MFDAIGDVVSKGFDGIGDVAGDLVGDAVGGLAGDAVGGVLGGGDAGGLFGNLAGAFGGDLLQTGFTAAGTMIGGPIGGWIGGMIGKEVGESLPDLLGSLKESPLGSGLSFPGFIGGGQTGMLSLLGQPTEVLQMLPQLASAKPFADIVGSIIAGGNPETAGQLSSMILNAVANAETPEQAVESIMNMSEKLGLDPGKTDDLLYWMSLLGLLTDEERGALSGMLPGNKGGSTASAPTGATPSAGGASGGAVGGAARSGGGDNTPIGGTIDGEGGFLWKPTSEGDGNLVVLAPAELAGDIAGVTIKDAAGNVLETGDYSGNANGSRDHFRFDKPGGAYGNNLTVEFRLNDGSVKTYDIAQGALRFD